ncbi:MAG TPA: D-alanine--D-alanine ligase family protein [Polyangia bacterium]|jgi:D-alanine-D-alanine ligase|nr:D-alanine--D-alanine ligase family protein [Polyangia bacterium]
MKKTRVIILFGGRSAEHEISLLSARNVLSALDRTRFEPVLVGIDKAGRWHRESERTLEAAAGDPRGVMLDASAPAVGMEDALVARAPGGALDADVNMGTLKGSPNPPAMVRGEQSSPAPHADSDAVVFPVLHGTFGEDGTVQGAMELAGIAYVGAGVLGSAIGMDKDVAKRLLRDAGIPVVDFGVVTAGAFRRDPAAALRALPDLGYPRYVKPANAGSSVGVSRAAGPGDLERAVRAALAFDTKVLVERAIDAREIECAVLGNDDPEASIPGEILVHHKDGFYSYDAKYVDPDGASWKIPADLPPEMIARVQAQAVATFRALELSGMARVDFFVARDGGAIYVNEVNTIPGFTAISMYPKMWEASGLSPRALITRLIELAIERRDARRSLKTTP